MIEPEVKPRLVFYPKPMFLVIARCFLYRNNIFLNRQRQTNSSIIKFSLFTSREKDHTGRIEVWVTFLCPGSRLQALNSMPPLQASFHPALSCRGLTACSLHLPDPLPDGFCSFLLFLGTGTRIRRLEKAKPCLFSLLEAAAL